jgi:hypothetical protein
MTSWIRVAILAAGTLALAVPLRAQTIANGPYYAVPSWDQTIPAATRFVVLANFGGKAVLDRETGLVWHRAPVQKGGWIAALFHCHRLSVGPRRGWRLPSIEELLSLTDENGILPAGHPFQGVDNHTGYYWSSTRFLGFAVEYSWVHSFGLGDTQVESVELELPLLCVRGGAGASGVS